eukprot:5091763-Pyramimonas_sp.AAC.1
MGYMSLKTTGYLYHHLTGWSRTAQSKHSLLSRKWSFCSHRHDPPALRTQAVDTVVGRSI